MLHDRDYMRRRPPSGDDYRQAASGVRALFGLIIANVIFFLLFQRQEGLALYPAEFRNGSFHQLVTAMFMHGGFMHLFFNMFSLYIFGSLSAPILGARKFLTLYFAAGIAGNLVWLLMNLNANTVLVGASGACMGVIMVTAMLMPNIEMFLLFIPFPIKLRTMALVFIAIEVFSELTRPYSGVAYIAHIAGFAAGYLYAVFFLRNCIQWDPLAKVFGKTTSGMPRGWRMTDATGEDRKHPDAQQSAPKPGTGPVTQGELDYLLDKISRQGINALSEAEMARLRQAREQMRGGK